MMFPSPLAHVAHYHRCCTASIPTAAPAGGFLQLRTGLKSAGKSAAFGGVLLAMIEGVGILLTRVTAPPPAPGARLRGEGCACMRAEMPSLHAAAECRTRARQVDPPSPCHRCLASLSHSSLSPSHLTRPPTLCSAYG